MAIEFLGPLALVALGARSWRNVVALGLAIVSVAILTEIRFEGVPLRFRLRVRQLRAVHALHRAGAWQCPR